MKTRTIEHDFATARRGAVIENKGKTRITIYLDDDVLAHFREGAAARGRGYQTEINQYLRAAMTRERSKLYSEMDEIQVMDKLGRIDFIELNSALDKLARLPADIVNVIGSGFVRSGEVIKRVGPVDVKSSRSPLAKRASESKKSKHTIGR